MLSLSKSSDNLNYDLPNKLRIYAFEETPLTLIQSYLPKDKRRWQLQQMVRKSSKGTTNVYNGFSMSAAVISFLILKMLHFALK